MTQRLTKRIVAVIPVRMASWYELALVHSEAAAQTYLDEGCRIDRVLVHGRKQDHVSMLTGPLPAKVNVGIFLCKDVNQQQLKTLVKICSRTIASLVSSFES